MMLVSLVCDVLRHDLCSSVRSVDGLGVSRPCYCACHFSGPSVSWQCSHHRGSDVPPDGRSHLVTDKQRAAIADFHRKHTIRRRPDYPAYLRLR